MRCYYDFHIHSSLSACAREDMTPNNIINMATLCELDAIAITDHNSCENVEVIMKLGKKQNIIVIPGMEIETKEEVHLVCLFPDIHSVYSMQNMVYEHLPNVKNKPNVLGEQLIFNENDEIIRYNDRLLLTAVQLSIEDIVSYVRNFNGVVIPAHIDRPSFSIISNLGWIPNNLNIATIEVSRYADYISVRDKYKNYQVIQSSDAHDLGSIFERNNYINVEKKSIEHILKKLNNK